MKVAANSCPLRGVLGLRRNMAGAGQPRGVGLVGGRAAMPAADAEVIEEYEVIGMPDLIDCNR